MTIRSATLAQTEEGRITATLVDRRIGIEVILNNANGTHNLHNAEICMKHEKYATSVFNGLIDRLCDEGCEPPATYTQFNLIVEGVIACQKVETL